MEYLQRMSKPDNYMWKEWHKFPNEQYIKSQLECKQKEEDLAKEKQKKMQEEAQLARDMCNQLTKNLLPVSFRTQSTSAKPADNLLSPLKMKTEPGLHTPEAKKNSFQTDVRNGCKSANGNTSDGVPSDIISKEKASIEKITELATLVKTFVMEVSDLIMDNDVVYAVRKLKQIGSQMKLSLHDSPQHSKTLQSPTPREYGQGGQALPEECSKHGMLPPHNLDFSPSHHIKQEPDQNVLSHKSMFPVTKCQTFEQFQESFQNKRRKMNTQSPARISGNLSSWLGSPKGGTVCSQLVDYLSLTDSKVAVIVQGNEVLKKRRSAKICKDIWTEAEHMNRVILDATEVNFYYLLSRFKPQYSGVPEALRAARFKEDLFDYILENVSYTKVTILL